MTTPPPTRIFRPSRSLSAMIAALMKKDRKPSRTPREFDEIVGFTQNQTSPIDELAPGRCDQYVPPIALEEADSERRLELSELGAERGLRHVTALRGLPEAQRVGDRHRVLQLPQREGRGP